MLMICHVNFTAQAQKTSEVILRRAGTNDLPIVPPQYSLTKLAQNLGTISAVTLFENDIFIAERETGRILRLRDQNNDGRPDVQTVFLIGFDMPSSLVASEDTLYIADNHGLWSIQPAQDLQAHTMPSRLTTLNPGQHPLALDPQKHTIYLGDDDKILAIDLSNNTTKIHAQGNWKVRAITIMPNGQLWSALQTPQGIHLTDTPTQNINTSPHLNRATIGNMMLWNKHIFISQSGAQPVITQHAFEYGDISDTPKTFIEGFSTPSHFEGKISKWGQPTAMSAINEEAFIFADSLSGTLWKLTKKPETLKSVNQETPSVDESLAQQDDKETEAEKPVLILRGSGIGKSELLKTDKNKK